MFNATTLAGWLAPPVFDHEKAKSGSQEVKEQVKVSVRTRKMFWDYPESKRGKKRLLRGHRTPNLIPQTPQSTTHMSASSSRLLVSAEKEVPKFRSSSSLILNGSHNVYRFLWV